jgi:hypothetical protein
MQNNLILPVIIKANGVIIILQKQMPSKAYLHGGMSIKAELSV